MRLTRPVIAAALAVVGAAALAGCGTSSSTPAASSLVGTWAGAASGYEKGARMPDVPLVVEITTANDADGTFAGRVSVLEKHATKVTGVDPGAQPIDGVIVPGTDITMVDNDGVFHFTLDGEDLVGKYVETGPDDPRAAAVTLTRQG